MFKLIFFTLKLLQFIDKKWVVMAHHLQYSNIVTPHHTKLNLTNETLIKKTKNNNYAHINLAKIYIIKKHLAIF